MSLDVNRLFLELEKLRKDVNRQAINPEIQVLSLDDLKPILQMVAHARAKYLREFFDMANATDSLPSIAQIQELGRLRATFDELISAAAAFDTAIQREYLDIKPRDA
jgi:hypothetical protein